MIADDWCSIKRYTAKRFCKKRLLGTRFVSLRGIVLISISRRLRMALSEQNLELLPDYEQRIEVLKALQFIDDNSTVLLKGRVACEVSTTSFSSARSDR